MTSMSTDIKPKAFEGEYPVSQKFWNYWPQMYKTNGGHHNGTDFALPTGTPLLAIFDGWVSRIERWQLTGYGRMVVMRTADGRYEALYGHMSEIDDRLKPGDNVSLGQKIGKSGNSGQSTGAHLHLSVWKDGALMDPLVFLNQPALFREAEGVTIRPTRHRVVSGDTLSGLARAYLGSSARWPEIFAANADILKEPGTIRVGQELRIPDVFKTETLEPETVMHTVARGETLSSIAQRYLGSAARWLEIYETNKKIVTNPSLIMAGMVLTIVIK